MQKVSINCAAERSDLLSRGGLYSGAPRSADQPGMDNHTATTADGTSPCPPLPASHRQEEGAQDGCRRRRRAGQAGLEEGAWRGC